MAESQSDVMIKLFQIALITIILVILIIRRRKYRIRTLNWMIWIFLFSLLHGIVELIIYYIKIYMLELSEPSHFRFNEYHTIFYAIGLLLIYLLAEFMDGYTPNLFRFTIISGLSISYRKLFVLLLSLLILVCC